MITLKLWNSLSEESRKQLASISGHASLYETFHHNFNSGARGASYQRMLSMMNRQRDGSINVVRNIKPTFAPRSKPRKTPSAIHAVPKKKRYYINVIVRNSGGEFVDDFNIWTDAYSEGEALNDARCEYGNKEFTITNVRDL